MKLTFLGTSDAIPSARRNHTSILLTYNGENIMVDCGEGTQRQLRKAGISPTKVDRLLITHWHGDHMLGIPGLIQTNALMGRTKTLYVYGPKGTKKFMKELLQTFVFAGNKYPIEVKEVDGKFVDEKDFYLESKQMEHGPKCNAYIFVKKGKIRIDKKKLAKSKLPLGPILAKLSKGKDIVHKGKKYKAKDLTYKQEEKKISFVLDTKINSKIVPFVKNSNVLISESSFAAKEKELAREHEHLTSEQAAMIAKKAKVGKLVLTHISQRYQKNLNQILKEAKKVFKKSVLVEDLDVISVD